MNELETTLATRPDIVLAVPLLAVLAVAAYIDFRERVIPNALSLGAAVIGVNMLAALYGPEGALLGAAGWAVGLICFMPFYVGGGMAAGDVKLMAAVGAFLGPVDVLFACVATAIAGGVLGFAYLVVDRIHALLAAGMSAGGVSGATVAGSRSTVGGFGKMPYAGAIAIGTAVVVLKPPFLAALFPGVWT